MAITLTEFVEPCSTRRVPGDYGIPALQGKCFSRNLARIYECQDGAGDQEIDSRINIHDGVTYWCKQLGVSPDKLKELVGQLGVSVITIRQPFRSEAKAKSEPWADSQNPLRHGPGRTTEGWFYVLFRRAANSDTRPGRPFRGPYLSRRPHQVRVGSPLAS